MNKLKLMLLTSIILPSTIFASDDYQPSFEFRIISDAYEEVTNSFTLSCSHQDEIEFFKHLEPLEVVKILNNIGKRFMDIEKYPELSMYETCDMIIYLLNRAEECADKSLPNDLKENIVQLIKDKRESTGAINFNGGHRLTNDIIIQFIDFIKIQIEEHQDIILEYISKDELKVINKELARTKKQAVKRKKSNTILNMSQISEKIENIGKKLKPILVAFQKRNMIDIPSLSAASPDEKVSPSYFAAVGRFVTKHVNNAKQSYNIMKIINHRISQNNKDK